MNGDNIKIILLLLINIFLGLGMIQQECYYKRQSSVSPSSKAGQVTVTRRCISKDETLPSPFITLEFIVIVYCPCEECCKDYWHDKQK